MLLVIAEAESVKENKISKHVVAKNPVAWG
jgi:hypothetical protein